MVNIINQTSMIYMSGAGRRDRLPDEPVQHRRRGAVHDRRRTAPRSLAGAAHLPGDAQRADPAADRAMAVGAIWAGIAGVLKVTRGVSEVISTIMLNAIAIAPDGYLLATLRRARPATRPAPRRSPRSSRLDGWAPFSGETATDLDAGVIAGVLLGVGVLRSCSTGPGSASTCARPACRRPPPSPAASASTGWSSSRCCCPAAIAGLIWMPAFFGDAHSLRHDVPGRTRLHRDRGRAARPQPADRHRLRRACCSPSSTSSPTGSVRDRHLHRHRADHPGRDRARRRHRLRGRTPLPRPRLEQRQVAAEAREPTSREPEGVRHERR